MSNVSRQYRPCCTIRRCTSTFGLCSRSRRHSFARTKPGTGLRQDYCICIIRDCVPRNFCPTYESENSVLSFFSDLAVFLSLSSPRSHVLPLPLQGTPPESLCTWPPVSRAVGSYSRRFERTRDDTVSLPLFPPFLYLVQTSLFLFARCLFKGGKEQSKRRESIRRSRGCSSIRDEKNQRLREVSRV